MEGRFLFIIFSTIFIAAVFKYFFERLRTFIDISRFIGFRFRCVGFAIYTICTRRVSIQMYAYYIASSSVRSFWTKVIKEK